MPNSPHRIRRLRWTVAISTVADAFVIRKRLHDHWQDLLLPAVEKVFDEAANGEGIIHIPKLELHLEVTSEQELMEVLPALIQQQLKEQLQSMLQENFQANRQAVSWKDSTSQQNNFDILLHYLQMGSLPWQAAHASTSEIAVELKEACRQQLSQLLDYLQNNPEPTTFYFRLMQLISEEELLTLVSRLFDSIPQAWRTAVVQVITSVLSSEQRLFNRYTQLHLVAALLSESLRKQEGNVIPNFASVAQSVLSREGKNTVNDFIASLPVSTAMLFQQEKRTGSQFANDSLGSSISEMNEMKEQVSSNNEEKRSRLDSESQLADGSPDNQISELNDTVEANRLFDNEVSRSNIDTAPSIFPNELFPTSLAIAPTDDEFPLAVKYAGLVLIHPFITRFFENTGVKEAGNAQLSSFAVAQAAALLHFLATGCEEVYEYELGFIKILLGLQPEIPLLISEGLIEPSDKEEAEGLLQSVISYWSVLKNTSINGLRSSFLQRQGLLREVEGGWQIQVERESFDMLLNQLPWSISIIKLPWMKKPIYTEWQMP